LKPMLTLHALLVTPFLWNVCGIDWCIAQMSYRCWGAQAELASITCELSRELEKAEQLIVTTKSRLANEQACSQSLAMALLEARAINEVGFLLFVASVASAVSWAHAPLIITQQPTSLATCSAGSSFNGNCSNTHDSIVACLSFLQEQLAKVTAQLAAQTERACGAEALADIKAGLLADECALSSSLAQDKRALKKSLTRQVDHNAILI